MIDALTLGIAVLAIIFEMMEKVQKKITYEN